MSEVQGKIKNEIKTSEHCNDFSNATCNWGFAAALDRSGQSMSAFFQPGNYFEAGISVLDPDVAGKEAGSSATRRDIGDMANDYYFPSAALKLQINDQFSFGLLYDQPFGADAEYSGNNVFVSQPGSDSVLSATAIDGIVTKKQLKLCKHKVCLLMTKL